MVIEADISGFTSVLATWKLDVVTTVTTAVELHVWSDNAKECLNELKQ